MIKRAIYWFRNNLRLRDNPSLTDAIARSEELLLVYVINPQLHNTHPLGFKEMWLLPMEIFSRICE
jgi:deoxyribodipyrimidine photo-lyase